MDCEWKSAINCVQQKKYSKNRTEKSEKEYKGNPNTIDDMKVKK